MCSRNTWASISSADFAQGGWFNNPTLDDIHPALRSPPAILAVDQDCDERYQQTILEMAALQAEGGGDKIIVPIYHNGADLSNIFQPAHISPKQPSKYSVFPESPQISVFPRVEPLKLRTERRTSQSRLRAQARDDSASDILNFPSPPPPSAAASRKTQNSDALPDSPVDPAFSPKVQQLFPATADRRSSRNSRGSVHSTSSSNPPPLASSWSRDSSISSPTTTSPKTSRSNRLPNILQKSTTTSTSFSQSTASTTNNHKQTTTTRFGLSKFLKSSSTPLIDCAKGGDYMETLRLLAPGSKAASTVFATDKQGMTALHWACKMGHTSIARLYIARHVDIEARTKQSDRTPLFFAAEGGWQDIVASLIDAGADVDAASTMDGARPLNAAVLKGHDLCAEMLLDHGSSSTVRDKELLPPIWWAIVGKQMNCVRVLAAHGADLNARIQMGRSELTVNGHEWAGHKGLTPLHRLVTQGNYGIARLLLELGADINAEGPHGQRALHMAAAKNDVAMCALLLEGGTDLSCVTDQGWTALHSAARNGHALVAKLLVKSGVEEGATTLDGKTARDLSREKGHGELF